jgi:5-carboxymethyl-2-hydroxymuconate isomerase
MPHLVILYTANLEPLVNMSTLCRSLADTMLSITDEAGQQVYPTGGTRVLAYPAAHWAVADGGAAGLAAGGTGDYGFVYLNLRMGRGRSDATKLRAGNLLLAGATSFFSSLLKHKYVGVTLQIDEGQEVFDGKLSTLHPLFKKPT